MLRVQQEAFKQLLDREQKEMLDRRRSGGVAVSSVDGTPDNRWMDGWMSCLPSIHSIILMQ